MRILLDTNILIHREAASVAKENVGDLFHWLDRLCHEKCAHPVSVEEIQTHGDAKVRRSFQTKLKSYVVLNGSTDLAPALAKLSEEVDRTVNDHNDTAILNELYVERVDLLITEDRGIMRKAIYLGIEDRVFTIDGYLEKVSAENPDFADYSVLSVRRESFANVPLRDAFFDSFRDDYPGFDKWFIRKSEEDAYVCREKEQIVAFLYLKVEDEREQYRDIEPPLAPKRRLKIGTLKVDQNGFKIGERFLKIVFDNALLQRVSEIYVTVYPTTQEREQLVRLLGDFGFTYHGEKHNPEGDERVYVRDMTPDFNASNPKLTYPYVSASSNTFLVSVYPKYHTELFPDSILRTEQASDFEDPEPHRNAIRKVYISRALNGGDIAVGDTLVFYRTGGHHKGVVSTLAVIDRIHRDIQDEDQFIRLCRKRSVFSNDELREHWNYRPRSRPFIVEFLYVLSFPKRPNLAALREHRVLQDIPRGFGLLDQHQLSAIMSLSQTDPGVVVHPA